MIRDDSLALLGSLVVVVFFGGPVLLWAANQGVLLPSAIGMLSRLATGLGGFWVSGLDASDAAQYHSHALLLAEGRDVGGFAAGKEAWPVLLSWIYRILGDAPEAGIILNAVAAAATVPVVFVACRRFGWERAAKPAAWIVALWPVGVVWSGLLVREALVILLLALALLGAALVRSGTTLGGFTLLAGSGVLLLSFRGGLAIIPLLVIPATLVLMMLGGTRISVAKRVLVATLVVGLAVLSIPALADIADQAKYFDWSSVASGQRGNNSGTTSVSAAGGVLGEFEGIPRGIANLPLTAFGPMVWGWSNFGLVMAGLDGLLWLAMAVLALLGVRQLREKANAIVCAVPLVMLLVYLGIGLANYGLLMRIRGVGVPFLAPLAALGIVVLLDRHKAARETATARNRPAATIERELAKAPR